MGIVWEAYHKGVPLLGVPGITLEKLKMCVFGKNTNVSFKTSFKENANASENWESFSFSREVHLF